jgi:hypothetical protein
MARAFHLEYSKALLNQQRSSTPPELWYSRGAFQKLTIFFSFYDVYVPAEGSEANEIPGSRR